MGAPSPDGSSRCARGDEGGNGIGDKSAIEWTDATWNPVTGCTKVSAGCDHCYAEVMALRLQKMGAAKYAGGFAVRTHESALDQPLRWKRPRRIFVNSMSDLFHAHVPLPFVDRVWGVMLRAARLPRSHHQAAHGAAMSGGGIALEVGMDYPGAVISVNHCYADAGGRQRLKREARRWRGDLAEALGWALYAEGLKGVPLEPRATVRIDAAYCDEANATDPTNLRKLVDDAVQEATGINDRHVQPGEGVVAYGMPIPGIVVPVTVWPKGGKG